jgi:hypothetical protein
VNKLSEETPERPTEEPASPYEPLTLETPQVDWVEKGSKHDDLETRDLRRD